jgi:hypothetical protein
MEEIWKDIEGYEGLYQVSNLGRIKSLPKMVSGNHYRGERIIGSSSGFYNRVCLYKNNKAKSIRIHRLVAKAFIPNLENKPEINHVNGNRLDNRVENLEWATPKENMRHAFDTGLNKGPNVNGNQQGEKHPISKLTEIQIIEIRRLYKEGGISQSQIGRKFGITQAHTGKIINKILWKHI